MTTWKMGDKLFISHISGEITTYEEKHATPEENLAEVLQEQVELRNVASEYLKRAEGKDRVAIYYMREIRNKSRQA